MSINDEEVLKDKVELTKPSDIDLNFAKIYLRIDFTDDDNDKLLDSIVTAAKSFSKNYLRFSDEEFDESSTEISIAILAITEHWYKNRGILNEDTTRQELPFVFSGILDLHRNWEVR